MAIHKHALALSTGMCIHIQDGLIQDGLIQRGLVQHSLIQACLIHKMV